MSERIQRMARMYEEDGLSYAEIAAQFGISRQRVHQLIGSIVEARPRRTPAERRQTLAAAYGRIIRNETTLSEEAESLGYANQDSLRTAMTRSGMTFQGRPRPSRQVLAPHGTPKRYRQECRCVPCRTANTQYNRKLRQSREAPNHGTDSGYRNYGCRCTPCTRAHTKTQRDRRAQARRERPRRGSAAAERRITS